MFQIGDRVERIENREEVSATVISIDDTNEEKVYGLEYDEGGTGWWPESCLRKLEEE